LKVVGRWKTTPLFLMESTRGLVQEKQPGPGFISARILPHLMHRLFSVGLSSMGKPFCRGAMLRALYIWEKALNLRLSPKRRTRRFCLEMARSLEISPRFRPMPKSVKIFFSVLVNFARSGGEIGRFSGLEYLIGPMRSSCRWVSSWAAYRCASGQSSEQKGFFGHSWQNKRHLPW